MNEPELERTLGLPVLATSLVKGVPANFTESLAQAKAAPAPELTDAAARLTWATSHVASTIQVGTSSKRADWLDRCTGHRILGPAIFLGLMTALFWCVFSVAGIPMGWIESFFALAKDAVAPLAGEGLFGEFIVDGVIGGGIFFREFSKLAAYQLVIFVTGVLVVLSGIVYLTYHRTANLMKGSEDQARTSPHFHPNLDLENLSITPSYKGGIACNGRFCHHGCGSHSSVSRCAEQSGARLRESYTSDESVGGCRR